mmetsp:Transcript_23558/g.66042  ORF Transcript_23558/g.66042 Transcript_23558/m.66042 type:complete len:306 (+) Transcript_23558:378-1295(+)
MAGHRDGGNLPADVLHPSAGAANGRRLRHDGLPLLHHRQPPLRLRLRVELLLHRDDLPPLLPGHLLSAHLAAARRLPGRCAHRCPGPGPMVPQPRAVPHGVPALCGELALCLVRLAQECTAQAPEAQDLGEPVRRGERGVAVRLARQARRAEQGGAGRVRRLHDGGRHLLAVVPPHHLHPREALRGQRLGHRRRDVHLQRGIPEPGVRLVAGHRLAGGPRVHPRSPQRGLRLRPGGDVPRAVRAHEAVAPGQAGGAVPVLRRDAGAARLADPRRRAVRGAGAQPARRVGPPTPSDADGKFVAGDI